MKNIYSFIYLSAFILLLQVSSMGQSRQLRGMVCDAQTGAPVAGAIVQASGKSAVSTNSNGTFVLSEIAGGSTIIRITHIAYKSLTGEITVTDRQNDQQKFILEPAVIPLDDIVVSSSRYEHSLRHSPYSEAAVSATELSTKTPLSIADVLKEQPGISLLRDGVWGTEISIRGLSRENVVTLIDGNRLATSTDIAARLAMIDINDIERIEVIKGAASSIYGSGATGGIVNIISKPPMSAESFFINGNFSSGFNTVNSSSLFSGALYSGGESWSSKFVGSFRKAENTKTPAGELKNSQFEDFSFAGSLNIRPLTNNLLKLNYQRFKALDVGIPGASVFPENADVRYPDEKRELFSAAYEMQNIAPFFTALSAKYSYQTISRNVENIPYTVQNIAAAGTQPARRVSMLKITPSAEHRNNNALLQGSFLFGADQIVLLGLDYWDRKYNGEREKYQKIEVLNTDGTVKSVTDKIIGEKPLPDCQYNSLGLFAQHNGSLIHDELFLSLGARADRVSVRGEGALNPVYEIVNGVMNAAPAGQKAIWQKVDSDDFSYSANAGLRYALPFHLDLTLSLGLSFRSPSLEERFQYIDQGSFVRVGRPDLKPERGKAADIGIRYYSPALKFVSSFFVNSFNELVAEVPGTFDGRNAYIKTNIGEARLSGFDARVDYNIWSALVIFASASYVKGEDLTANAPLADIAPLNGTSGLRSEVAGWGHAEFSAAWFTAQNRVAAGEPGTPGYAVFNVYFTSRALQFGGAGLSAAAGLENIFDKEYRNHLSTGRGLIKNEPGRNFFLKINVNW